MRFTDAHSPSSVCTPTRYGLLTGRYAWRTRLKEGVLDGYDPLLIETNRLTLPALLQQRGYYTAAVGKWHLGLGTNRPTDFSQPLQPGPNAVGFEYFFGIAASLDMPPYVFLENDRVTTPPTNHIGKSEMRRQGGGGFWREGAIAPGFRHEDVLPRLAEKTEEILRRQTPARPFFLYLALNSPHTPWMPRAEFRGRSGADWYGDFVAQTDDVVGRVLRTLEATHLAERTLVIFTSDNGAHWLPADIEKFGHRANGSRRGQKGDVWEGGHRVPFLVRWPAGVPAGTRASELICLTDVMATLAALVEVPLPRDAAEDSFNFLNVLYGQNPDRPVRDYLMHHTVDGTFGVRQGEWKWCPQLGSHGFSEPQSVTPRPDGPQGQLYNLTLDPAEKTNVWQAHPDVVGRLARILEECQAKGRSR
jgi:arylsulfatase A-like enzyme